MPGAYITIEDFKAGLDGRRLASAAEVGSLQALENAHINRGGEIVKAKKWAAVYALPPNTHGLAVSGGGLHVFGSIATPAGIPSGVTYHRLRNPDNSAMTGVVDAEVFSGGLYVAATYADGTTHQFDNDARVTDWYYGLVRTSLASLNGIVTEMSAGMTIDPVMDATVSGATITMTGKEDNVVFTVTGSAVNGGSVDDQTITITETQTAAAGLPQITTVTIGGTFDPGDMFSITVDDNLYGAISATGEYATTLITHKNKMYAGAGTNLFFSAIADAGLWTDNTEGSTANAGSGVIDLSAQSAQDEDIVGTGEYQDLLAVFMRNSIQIWSMDADPDTNIKLQTLANIGTRAPKSIQSFGDIDVFFLADSGYRSLRARDSSNSATTSDVGTPIDDIVQAKLATLTDAQVLAAPSTIEPKNGRYIGVLDDIQYVFSYFPGSKISAWSTYAPGFSISDFAVLNGRLYGRAGDIIYLLGGADDDELTTRQVVVELPYIDTRTIGHFKHWTGLDVICEGKWTVEVNTNPREPDEWVTTAVITETSIGEMNFAMQQYAPVIKLRFTHQDASENAVLSKIILHYEKTWAG